MNGSIKKNIFFLKVTVEKVVTDGYKSSLKEFFRI
ncbi:hypothetical protein BN439_pEA290008 (plasmid) [Erwinia amylovora Ea644]|nr:hypothetical protein BN439_pEA290008 [Erwinia amylovora Ea644]CCP05036.1 hypothetical protein BN440_pEA290009 [Erwinia amylovora MR1]